MQSKSSHKRYFRQTPAKLWLKKCQLVRRLLRHLNPRMALVLILDMEKISKVCDLNPNKRKHLLTVSFHFRHSPVHVETSIEPHLHCYMSRRLYGTNDCLRVRRFPPQVSGDPIQPWKVTSKCLYWQYCGSWCLYWHLYRWLHPQAIPTEAEGRCAICTDLKYHLSRLLYLTVLPGV